MPSYPVQIELVRLPIEQATQELVSRNLILTDYGKNPVCISQAYNVETTLRTDGTSVIRRVTGISNNPHQRPIQTHRSNNTYLTLQADPRIFNQLQFYIHTNQLLLKHFLFHYYEIKAIMPTDTLNNRRNSNTSIKNTLYQLAKQHLQTQYQFYEEKIIKQAYHFKCVHPKYSNTIIPAIAGMQFSQFKYQAEKQSLIFRAFFHLALLMPTLPGLTLSYKFFQLSTRLSLGYFIVTSLAIIDAAYKIHEMNLCHGDLSPNNILISELHGQLTANIINFDVTTEFNHPLQIGYNDPNNVNTQFLSPDRLTRNQAELGRYVPAKSYYDTYAVIQILLCLLRRTTINQQDNNQVNILFQLTQYLNHASRYYQTYDLFTLKNALTETHEMFFFSRYYAHQQIHLNNSNSNSNVAQHDATALHR